MICSRLGRAIGCTRVMRAGHRTCAAVGEPNEERRIHARPAPEGAAMTAIYTSTTRCPGLVLPPRGEVWRVTPGPSAWHPKTPPKHCQGHQGESAAALGRCTAQMNPLGSQHGACCGLPEGALSG